MAERSLGKGFIGAGETVLYTTPNNSECHTSLLSFTNVSSETVALTIYKKVANVSYAISPFEMEFPSHYLCQEDGPITLNSNDQLIGVCDVADAVAFTINGNEFIKPKT